MSTIILLETPSPDTGPGEPETQIRTSEQVELPMDEIQTALTEDQINNSSQIRTSLIWQKWIYYLISWAMLFSSFAVIIAGMTSRHEDGWGLAFIV